jgi:hypothetical protein
MTNPMFIIYSFIYEKFILAQGSVLNLMYRSGLVATLVTHANTNGVWPNFLVWSLPWFYAISVKNKQTNTFLSPIIWPMVKKFLEPFFFLYLGILALLIYLYGEVSKKSCNCSSPFERKGNWSSVNAFLYFN